MGTVWDPQQYLRFNDHRTRPAQDLLARVPLEAPAQVVDLGCGPGNSTRALKARWPQAQVTGLDNDLAMLASARAADPQGPYASADAALWRPGPEVDLLFSNAVLQWLGDHATLFPALLAPLRPGAVLAVQIPGNHHAPSHTLLAETAASRSRWQAVLEPVLRPDPVLEPMDYHRLLAPLSAGLDVWETTYVQALTGEDPVLEWVRPTRLRVMQAALRTLPDGAAEAGAFEAAYAARLRTAYPQQADGSTLFPFRRIFMVAVRAGG
ncbi:methyltransferase domain-containing protein [Novispirillum itersonii]|uniref:Trans-aconitate 2-methyltransferase n=1 Tax=Novispirillum itersonii TaxID=189 RepID=A0A7W9ZGF1_NOVIT|nr:methyltransferase domain-containing protein [Novispirillum itersonii]MBB6211026.1 trans-aconitate 2-methyltransferase [Novispirillum itersonii]